MKNFVKSGKTIAYLIPDDGASPAGDITILPGEAVSVGNDMVGIATVGGVTGDTINLDLTGVYTLDKVSADTIAQGDKVYYDHVNKKITDAADDAGSPVVTFRWAGWACETAGNGVTSIDVKLRG